MELTWFGQGSFKIKSGVQVIYINPSAGDVSQYVEPATLIVLSSAAPDHWSRELINRVSSDDCKIIALPDVQQFFAGAVRWQDERTFEFDEVKVKRVHEFVHVTRQGQFSSVSFLLGIEGKTLLYNYDRDGLVKLRGLRGTPIDIAILSVCGVFLMSVDAAIAVVQELVPSFAIPSHYGSHDDYARLFRERVQSETRSIPVVLDMNVPVII